MSMYASHFGFGARVVYAMGFYENGELDLIAMTDGNGKDATASLTPDDVAFIIKSLQAKAEKDAERSEVIRRYAPALAKEYANAV
jgi:hypothetical protein